MASANQQKENILPYGTTSDNVVKLLEAIKNKQGDEKGIRAVYSGSKFDSTQSALETLNIISGLVLTEIGKQIVFEDNEGKKKAAYLKAVLGYAPYDYFLSYVAQSGTTDETEVDTLKNFWGRNNYGTANNRSEGAPVCFTFFQLAGLGEYVIGRKGKSTRFIWKDNFSELIEQSRNGDFSSQKQEAKIVLEEPTQNIVEKPDLNLASHDTPIAQLSHSVYHEKKTNSIVPATIEIKVDMTEWEMERIEKFFNLISGEQIERD